MSRIIEFRGFVEKEDGESKIIIKDKEIRGNYVYGGCYEWNNQKFIIQKDIWDVCVETANMIKIVQETCGAMFLDNPQICKTKIFEHDFVKIYLPKTPGQTEHDVIYGKIEFDDFDGRYVVNELHNGKYGWDYHYIHGDMKVEVVGTIFDNIKLNGEI